MPSRLNVPPSRVEHDNRKAFTIQLNALLAQILAITTAPNLAPLNKAKLADLAKTAEKWVADLAPTQSTPAVRLPQANTSTSTLLSTQQQPKDAPPVRQEKDASAERSEEGRGQAGGAETNRALSSENGKSQVEERGGGDSEQQGGEEADIHLRQSTDGSDDAPMDGTAHEEGSGGENGPLSGTEFTRQPTFSMEMTSNSTLAIPTTSPASATPTPSLGKEQQQQQQQQQKQAPQGSSSAAQSPEAAVDLAQVAQFISTLFTSGLPEFIKLRAIGKSAVQLLMIRSFSVMTLSMQHLLNMTYSHSAPQDRETPESTNHFPTFGTPESSDFPSADESEEDAVAPLVVARELRVSIATIRLCLEMLARNTSADDPASIRFTMKACSDAVKQVRKIVGDMQVQFVLEEIQYHRRTAAATLTAALELASQDENGKSDAELDGVWDLNDDDRVHDRVEAIRKKWGVAVCHTLDSMQSIVYTAVHYILGVASTLETNASSTQMQLKRDAKTMLFGLADLACSLTLKQILIESTTAMYATSPVESNNHTSPTEPQNGERRTQPQNASITDSSMAWANKSSLSSAAFTGFEDGASALTAANILTATPRISTVAERTVSSLTDSLLHNFLPTLARDAGDNNEGQLLALKLMQDMLVFLAENEVEILHKMLGSWSRRKTLMNGIANCVASPHRPVLVAALECLFRVATTSFAQGGQELGYVYSNCVYRMLECGYVSLDMKKIIVAHLIRTFLEMPRNEDEPPILLRIFYMYDLNVRLHHLNLIQRFVVSLAKIVRLASPDDFIPHTPTSATEGSDDPAAEQTLPFMALHGLVIAIEILTTQLPRSGESNVSDNPHGELSSALLHQSPLKLLRPLPNRDAKQQDQHRVDKVNLSPLKGIIKTFGVTAEELHPPGFNGIAVAWAATELPPPATPATREKVDAVARFLLETPSLNMSSIADILSEPSVFTLQVCQSFIRSLDLAGLSVISAIEVMLTATDLPKEGQRIERLLEYFCQGYYTANASEPANTLDPDVFPFADTDAAFIVVAATVMLNTNLHNSRVEVKMPKESFGAQLRGCNGGRDFPTAFLDSIYYAIAARPLLNVNHPGAQSGAASAPAVASRMDTFFFSMDERKEMSFGIERQRFVQETHTAVMRYSVVEKATEDTWRLWSSVARDLFLSTWPSLNVVFGKDDTSADQVMWHCVKGLQNCMCVAAAFELHTEAEVTLKTLMRVGQHKPIGDLCARAALVVAASEHSVHYPAPCWGTTMQLVIDIQKENRQHLTNEIEAVLARIEEYTSHVCEYHGEVSEDVCRAVDAILRGLSDCLKAVKKSDGLTLSAGLYVLRRTLSYSTIIRTNSAAGGGGGGASHPGRDNGMEIAQRFNVTGLHTQIMRTLLDLALFHGESDECLQVLIDFLVRMLYDMWQSFIARASGDYLAASLSALRLGSSSQPAAAGAQGSVEAKHASGSTNGKHHTEANVPKAEPGPASKPVSFVVMFESCYNIFRSAFDHPKSTTLVKTHILRGVKELMTRTLNLACSSAGHNSVSEVQLYMAFSVWKRLMYPLVSAMSNAATVNSDASTLAALVLSHLVVQSCGTGSNATSTVPAPVRSAFTLLLIHVAYVGAMCSSTDIANTCLSQLISICTTALNDGSLASATGNGGNGHALAIDKGRSVPSSSKSDEASQKGDVALSAAFPSFLSDDVVLHEVIQSLLTQEDFIVLHTLERLCLLLRCEKEATRNDAVESLGTLSMQLMQSHIRHLVVHLCDIVLEASLGNVRPNNGTPMTDPSLLSFILFDMEVPVTMKKCSRTVFRVTLPPALNLMTHELLARVDAGDLASTATVIVERCLAPLIVSPRVSAFEYRSLAVRSLMQCVALCVSKKSVDVAEHYPAQSFYNTIALILSTIHIRSRFLLPEDADFEARQWLDSQSPVLREYESLASQCVARLAVSETADISGRRAVSSVSVERKLASQTRAAAQSAGPNAPPASSSSGSTSAANRERNEASELVATSDEALAEFCTLASHMLAPLPKILALLSLPQANDPQTSEEPESNSAQNQRWRICKATPDVLAALLLRCAGTSFALFWRISRPLAVRSMWEKAAVQSNGAIVSTMGGGVNQAINPHGFIRGALTSYLEIALRSSTYSLNDIVSNAVIMLKNVNTVREISHTVSVKQTSRAVSGHPQAPSSLHPKEHQLHTQQLSSAEQSRIRSCCAGMDDELYAVLERLVRVMTGQKSFVSMTASKQRELQEMAKSPVIFAAIVSILNPTAGSFIVIARDYFQWYVETNRIGAPQADAAAALLELRSRESSPAKQTAATPPPQPQSESQPHIPANGIKEASDEFDPSAETLAVHE